MVQEKEKERKGESDRKVVEITTRSVVIGLFMIHGGALVSFSLSSAAVAPFTLQTLACVLAGHWFGVRDGCISALLYVVACFIGLPVLAGSKRGLDRHAYGYVCGFIFCTYFAGGLTFGFNDENKVAMLELWSKAVEVNFAQSATPPALQSFWSGEFSEFMGFVTSRFLMSVVAQGVVLLSGAAWLLYDTAFDLQNALQKGAMAYLPSLLFKALFAAVIAAFTSELELMKSKVADDERQSMTVLYCNTIAALAYGALLLLSFSKKEYV